MLKLCHKAFIARAERPTIFSLVNAPFASGDVRLNGDDLPFDQQPVVARVKVHGNVLWLFVQRASSSMRAERGDDVEAVCLGDALDGAPDLRDGLARRRHRTSGIKGG